MYVYKNKLQIYFNKKVSFNDKNFRWYFLVGLLNVIEVNLKVNLIFKNKKVL